MSDVRTVYTKARAETAKLLGYGDDIDGLSPEQATRLDIACALRIVIDDQAAKLLRGESADVSKLLSTSEALGRLLPPAVLASPPPEPHGDPRQVMWEIYKTMRERGEIGLKALPPEGGHQTRIEELEAENERLKAQLAGKPLEHSDVATVAERVPRGGSTVIDPAESDIVPPSELGVCHIGTLPGPDDPLRRSPPVIEGRAVKRPKPPAASAAPQSSAAPQQYDYSREQGWKDYVEADGTIRSTPRGRGHYWGPV